jgi:alpha-amylase/alpha-mannosidase (GH57 family)
MSDNPLHIAFVWHMHQPYYRDAITGLYRLPWVRLHGTKDYLDMVEVLRDFPDIKQTFNFTPSLLEQLIDYTENLAHDIYLELTRKKANELTSEDRVFLLEHFFLANWETMIKPFPRYHELLVKRGLRLIRSELMRKIRYFSEGDFLDLQVLFNLSWIDPVFREKDPFLSMLVQKGRNFSEEDKHTLISKQFGILNRIIPAYREMTAKGQVELSVSPFYHPILPLLCDTNSARMAMPDIQLPRMRFTYPQDAEKQIRMGIDYFEKLFGYRPVGMWPSEGSVSEEAVRIAVSLGIQWLGTDENILAASLGRRMRDGAGNINDPGAFYRPYRFGDASLIFRDHSMSDLIGFVYSGWEAKRAADDFIGKLVQIWMHMPKNKPQLVSIILDGENAWEYYKNDGHDFFMHLYDGLSKDKRLKTVLVSEYLSQHDRGEHLQRLHAGSWINANFRVWIGHEEDNRAWDYLTEARNDLELYQTLHPEKDLPEAWKAIYAAEGSDWNWWYGDEHSTELQKDFDELFRLNLMKVYKEMGREIPAHLFVPVQREERSVSPTVTIRGFVDPNIDGIVTSYFEWYHAAAIDVKKSGGSMHKAESLLSSLHYGFNKDSLFLRLDFAIPVQELPDDTRIVIIAVKPSESKLTVSLKPFLSTAELFRKNSGEWQKIRDVTSVAFRDIFEIGIPFRDFEAKEKDEMDICISLMRNGEEMERCPWRGYISFTVPTSDFEKMMWS